MEDIDPIIAGKYGDHGDCDVVEKVRERSNESKRSVGHIGQAL